MVEAAGRDGRVVSRVAVVVPVANAATEAQIAGVEERHVVDAGVAVDDVLDHGLRDRHGGGRAALAGGGVRLVSWIVRWNSMLSIVSSRTSTPVLIDVSQLISGCTRR